ncbi:haloalkane dehalogenase [Hahella sp. SMD15-11]|uniref:Haloalkane dehalogenase n=1 Tax=Thermohahella caldifontis TaxID=3142973 RepID=A0AB39UZD9_9GAMM
MTRVYRTPDSQFENLPDYPFAPHYTEVDGLRMHYVDEGPRDGEVVLMLHGEPTWSYLYRHMIPRVAAAGYRVIAPDLIGFGKSDKLTDVAEYSYVRHVMWMKLFLDALSLEGITLVCQDWGSLIGLRLAAENEHRFARVVVGNGFLPTGDDRVPMAFHLWRAFALYTPWFPVGRIVNAGCLKSLSDAEMQAYDAPFPERRAMAGARAFPKLVPTAPNNPATAANRAAWKVLERWQKPVLTCFGTHDPIFKHADKRLQERIPGARGLPHRQVKAAHFLQEDAPEAFADAVLDAMSWHQARSA